MSLEACGWIPRHVRKEPPSAESSGCVWILLPCKQCLICKMEICAKFPPRLLKSLDHSGAAAGWCQNWSQFHLIRQISVDMRKAWQLARPSGGTDSVSSLQNLFQGYDINTQLGEKMQTELVVQTASCVSMFLLHWVSFASHSWSHFLIPSKQRRQ